MLFRPSRPLCYLFVFVAIMALLGMCPPKSLAQTAQKETEKTAQAANMPAESFNSWLAGFKQKAAADGISQKTLDEAFKGVTPHQRVIELDRKQPEGTMTFEQYRERIVNPIRIKKGREMLAKNRTMLEEIGRHYGVSPQYIVALWGIETNYGSNTGGFDIVQALATLAWEGRRSSFFTKELLEALQILDQGHVGYHDMKGSWAGAMGQNQFMPSSFFAYAQDYNKDGRKDIWTTLPDVFASTANYLARSGWHDGEKWGRQVIVPKGLSENLVGKSAKRALAGWEKLGVRAVGNTKLPQADMMAYLVAPDGLEGPTYLVYNNFDVIKRWNRSDYFATSVGLLADEIAR